MLRFTLSLIKKLDRFLYRLLFPKRVKIEQEAHRRRLREWEVDSMIEHKEKYESYDDFFSGKL